ncbi:MAG: hypothetical protein ABIQ95_11800 [Bdellovibrionia bacterium]
MSVWIFWLFEILNGLTSLGMFFAPKRFHNSLFKNPQQAYQSMGFSSTAVEMVHNVIRGQGAALLAISVYLLIQGAEDARSYALIALTCTFSFVAHVFTARHHLKSPIVMAAIGAIKPLYGILIINLLVAVSAFGVFWNSR